MTSPSPDPAVAMIPALLPSSPAPRPSVRKDIDVMVEALDPCVLSLIIVLSVRMSCKTTDPSARAIASTDSAGVGSSTVTGPE